MNANELMIGDWVLCDKNAQSDYEFDNVNYQPFQILNGNDIDYAIERNMIGDADVYQPIPLTGEILEKNGFKNKKGRFMQIGNFDNPPLIMWHLVDDIILGHPKSQLEIHYGDKSMHVSFVCSYVHNLQHALKLCGIEKEITL